MTMIHIVIFALNLMGFALIIPTMQRHQRRFAKLFSFLTKAKTLQKLRFTGFGLICVALLLSVSGQQPWFYLVAWFGWLSLAAGVLFVMLQVHERLGA